MSQVPVTVIGGFLGSGKTTLLNNVLNGTHGIRYAVMVNDFGSLAIDEALVRRHDGETISFANGCVCCSMGDNLISAIDKMLEQQPPPQHFLIEISGVANPKTIADVATLHPSLRRDVVITMTDAETVLERVDDQRLKDTLVMQLKPADVIVINKSDLVSMECLASIRKYFETQFHGHVIETVQASLPKGLLSSNELINGESVMDLEPPDYFTNNNHFPENQFYRLSIELPNSVRKSELTSLLRKYQSHLLRAKGFVSDDHDDNILYSVQLSGKQIDVEIINTEKQKIHRPVLVVISTKSLVEFEQAVIKNDES